MSSLWTPGGEHSVDPEPDTDTPAADPALDDAVAAALPEGVRLDDLTPDQRAQAEHAVREMAQARERLLATPASVVVANHGMGLYELAALHLASQPANLAEATVAIDALAALVDGMAGRLGEAEPTLRSALDQLRVAFVQMRGAGNTED